MKPSGAPLRQTRPLFRLIYVSRIAPQARTRLDSVTRYIHDTSLARNTAAEVTGLLLSTNTHCAEALEGDERTVEAIYADIRQYPHQVRCKVVVKGPIEQRAFAGWSMCAPSLSPSDKALVAQLENRANFDLGKLTDTALLALLEAVARGREAAAEERRVLYL